MKIETQRDILRRFFALRAAHSTTLAPEPYRQRASVYTDPARLTGEMAALFRGAGHRTAAPTFCEERVDGEWQWVFELGRDPEARLGDKRAHRCSAQLVQVADLLGALPLGGTMRGEVVLEGDFHQYRPADSRHLSEERRRIWHVLEHVRDREL